MPSTTPRVLVVGGGFAGFYALQSLQKSVGKKARLTLVSPSDYLLYSPLLPDVAIGALDPRDITVSLRQKLAKTQLVLGHVVAVDLDGHTVEVLGRDGKRTTEPWDRLVLAPGSVTRQFDIPGIAEHSHGLKTLDEATFLRNHLLTQLDLADAVEDTPEGKQEREERLTVVAVGAGYTGTEFVAQMQHTMTSIADRWENFGPKDVRWLLVDVAPKVLPELGDRLGARALKVLHDRGIEVRLGVSIQEATATHVVLTDGRFVPTRTIVWGAGVAASPLIATLQQPTEKGRLVVAPDLSLPGFGDVWALGDAAAVPDLSKPAGADGQRPITAPTAQHAQRQGKAVAHNVAASLGVGTSKDYRHRDLGLVADLGGWAAVAKPLGIPLHGPVAKVVARGYHLYALPSKASRVRVGLGWLLAAVLPTRVVQLDDVRPEDALVRKAQDTDIY